MNPLLVLLGVVLLASFLLGCYMWFINRNSKMPPLMLLCAILCFTSCESPSARAHARQLQLEVAQKTERNANMNRLVLLLEHKVDSMTKAVAQYEGTLDYKKQMYSLLLIQGKFHDAKVYPTSSPSAFNVIKDNKLYYVVIGNNPLEVEKISVKEPLTFNLED